MTDALQRAEQAKQWAACGELDRALQLTCEIAEEAPHEPVLESLLEWLTPPVIRGLGIAPFRSVVASMARMVAMIPLHGEADDAQLRNVDAAVKVLERVRGCFPDQAPLYVAEALVRRRAGDIESALEVALAGAHRFPDAWACQTAALRALADADRLEEALPHARRALELRPEDGSPLHDIAWAFLRAGRPGEAAELFGELKARFPDYDLSSP